MTTATGLAPKRADELEHLLGRLADPANPTGARAILAADERAETLTAGESLLHAYGLNAEFVPPELGGRLDRADHLAEVMRSLYRRDPALGLGYGASSLIAGVTLWTAGDAQQRGRAARLLLDGRRIAIAFHELAHGNDMAGTEFTATTGADGSLRLSGRKEVVTNIRRADALVVLARTDPRTDPRPGPRSHSLVLVDRADADPAHLTDLPRFGTVGMRGVQLGGLVFDELPVPASAILGPVGSGLETALKALQITRTVLPTMATGILDTGLRIAVDHLTRRRLYGGAATGIPHVRSELAAVFADLLRAEAFGAVGARALHLVPGAASVYASAVKFEVSRLLLGAMDRLAALLGAHFYLREGPTALFQKLLRDLAPVGFGHIARAACQMSLLPQLPLLARRTWAGPGTEPPGDLCALAGPLPPLRHDRLTLHAGGRDPVTGSLHALADAPWAAEHADLRTAVSADRADLAELAAVCGSLSPVDLGVDARPEHYDLVTRYVRLLSRTACVQVWRHAPPGDFLADPAWLRAALHRSEPGPYGPGPLPAPVEATLFAELLDRRDTGRSFGLTGRPLAV